MPTPSAPEPLRRLVEPLAREAGLDLEELRVSPAGRRRLLRVVVDADGGVTLDTVAALSERISAVLDASDVDAGRAGELLGTGPYVLEVTSPGVDRPLTEPRHWRRATDRLVRAVLKTGAEVRGRVKAVDGQVVTLDVEGRDRELHLVEVAKARVEVEFRRRQQRSDDSSDGAEDEIEDEIEHDIEDEEA